MLAVWQGLKRVRDPVILASFGSGALHGRCTVAECHAFEEVAAIVQHRFPARSPNRIDFLVLLTTLNFGPSSVVFPDHVTSIIRVVPLPRHGSADVPIPFEPSGQSSRGLGGGGGVGAGVGAAATAEAVASAGAASSFFSSSQPRKNAKRRGATRSQEDGRWSFMVLGFAARW
jgi:hypothetical protein